MASPPHSVWVEVATELLADLGDWSKPVQVRIHDLRPNGQVQMELRTSHGVVINLDEAKIVAWALYNSHNEGQDYDPELAHRLHEWIASQDPDWSWDRKRFLRQGEDPHAAPYVHPAGP